MRKDPTEFRKRFAKWKETGEYELPRFGDGEETVDWKRWDDAQLTSYSVPFIKEKKVKLTNAGLATGAVLSTNLLDSIADNADRAGLPLETALGIAVKESTLGNPTDDRSAWNLSSGIRRAFNNKYPGTELHINYWEDALNEREDVINYHKGHLSDDPNSKGKSVLLEAFEFYRKHPDKYNPGLKGYLDAVNKRGSEVILSPEILAWKTIRDSKKAYQNSRWVRPNPALNKSRFNLPKFEGGEEQFKLKKTPEFVQAGKDNSWSKVTNDDMGEVFQSVVARPNRTGGMVERWRNGEKVFDAGRRVEKSDNTSVQKQEPVLPVKRSITKSPVVPESWVEKKQKELTAVHQGKSYTLRRIDEETKRTWLSDAADISHSVGEGALIAAGFINPEMTIATNAAYNTVKLFVTKMAMSNTPAMQYLRYPIGKMIYGLDAKFPTLYRKIKAIPTLPENGMVQITNPNPRFAFLSTGEESPVITNFTYDAPVRKHASGNWDSGYTMAMPGRKTLLGKNVISTEPSDLFTYGDNIKVPLKDVTIISGDPGEVALARQYGYNTYTSPQLQQLYLKGASPGVSFKTSNGRSLSLIKEDLSEYAKQVELDSRSLFGSPTKNDVNFMNFVLQPKIKGRTYDPNMLDYLVREGVEPFGDRIGNAELRRYLLDSERWGNLLYDPATHAEANFRKTLGIVKKKDIPINMRKWE